MEKFGQSQLQQLCFYCQKWRLQIVLGPQKLKALLTCNSFIIIERVDRGERSRTVREHWFVDNQMFELSNTKEGLVLKKPARKKYLDV